MFNIEELSPAAKAEAMRCGHNVILDANELVPFLNQHVSYLEEGETYSIAPLGTMAGAIFMYAVRIIPVLRLKV